MRIAQVSDFHFTRLTWNPSRLFSKRILGNLSWLFSRKNNFSSDQLEPLPQIFSKLGVDLVLLGGDFTTTALSSEFEIAEQFIKKIKQPWIAIPGNHDHYTKRAYRTHRYYNYFSNSTPEGPYRLAEHGLEIHILSPEWTLIAMDTAHATSLISSAGLLSLQLETHLEKALQSISSSTLLFNHYPFLSNNDKPRHSLQRGEALEKLLTRHPKVRLYLHGHTHHRAIADLQPSNLPVVLDSGSAAQSHDGSWNLIDLGSSGCTVTGYRFNAEWTPFQTQEIIWTR